MVDLAEVEGWVMVMAEERRAEEWVVVGMDNLCKTGLSPPEPAAHGKARIDPLFLLLLARRSGGRPAGVHAPVDVLLFLFGWFEDLPTRNSSVKLS